MIRSLGSHFSLHLVVDPGRILSLSQKVFIKSTFKDNNLNYSSWVALFP